MDSGGRESHDKLVTQNVKWPLARSGCILWLGCPELIQAEGRVTPHSRIHPACVWPYPWNSSTEGNYRINFLSDLESIQEEFRPRLAPCHLWLWCCCCQQGGSRSPIQPRAHLDFPFPAFQSCAERSCWLSLQLSSEQSPTLPQPEEILCHRVTDVRSLHKS